MKHSSIWALAAGLFLASSFVASALADDTPASVKKGIGHGPAVQQSLPSSASRPTTTKHTGATNQGKTVKSMNREAKEKVETEGK